jgi:hypothetical protein
MLEKSTALGPFTQKFVALASIATAASKHNKIHIMTRIEFCARNGDCVFNIVEMLSIFALLKFYMAIIASVLLSFQLSLDLLNGQRAFDGLFADAPFLRVHSTTCTLFFQVSCIITSLSCQLAFPVSFPVPLASFSFFFPVFCIVPSTTCVFLLSTFFTMFFIVLFPLRAYLFFVRFTVGFLSRAYLFFVLLGISLILFLVGVVVDFSIYLAACFAMIFQTFSRISIKKFRGSRKPLKALCTLLLRGILRYTVHTVKLILSSSRPGSALTLAGANQYLFIPQVYHKMAYKSRMEAIL